MSTPLYHTKPLLEIQSLRKYFGSGSHPVRAVDDVIAQRLYLRASELRLEMERQQKMGWPTRVQEA